MRELLLATALLSSAAIAAQTVLLNETFEGTNGQAPPSGWSWIGSPPQYVAGADSPWGISKESYDLSVPPPPVGSTSLLFHPLPYDAALQYRVTGSLAVFGPGAATAAAGALLCWIDLGTGQFVSQGPSITSFSPFYQFQSSGFYFMPGNSVGPNAQFGIMLTCGIGDGNAYAAFDNIMVTSLLPTVAVRPRLWLDGAYDPVAQLMRDDLRVAGLIPATEPYSAIMGGPGGETVAPSVLAVTGNDAIVDWVRVELRIGINNASTHVRHALLQRDGDVVDVDGTSPVVFNATPGLYRTVVRHRNHLAVMTATQSNLTATPVVIDFRASATSCHARPAPFTDLPRKTVGSTNTLWSGNVIGDDRLRYMGANNDRDPILVAIGGAAPTATVSGYLPADVNLDGVVKYVGTNNDRDPILENIGGSTPTAVRIEQVP